MTGFLKIMVLFIIFLLCGCKGGEKAQEPLYTYDVEEKIKELGIELREPRAPAKLKIALAVKSENLLYLSGNLPFSVTGEKYVGKLGSDLTPEEGYKAARLVGINHLATLKKYLGDLNKVEKIVKVLGMVNSEPDFTNQTQVMNGFSDLMYEVFGERGLHARSAVGMAAIPFNGACEIEMIVQFRGDIIPQEIVSYATQTTKMDKKQVPIIEAAELLKISKNKNLVLIDTRPNKAHYLKSHLEGAQHMDLNKELSAIEDSYANGGRHPLPSVQQFSDVLTSRGISKESHIVLYDDTNGAIASSRLWWMLRSVGHEKVQVLNGGLKEAKRVGFSMRSEIKEPPEVEPYKIRRWNLPLVYMAEVEEIAQSEKHRIIDVRAKERYNGQTEPIDLVAGHIPGALNVPFSSNLDKNGLFLSPEILQNKYQKIVGPISMENVVVHCGSGVTACHTLLAMDYAGLEIPALYVGSWSEWSRNNKTIATANSK